MEDGDIREISGDVRSVRFRSERDGYTVLEIAAGERRVTVVGKTAGVAVGEEIRASGRFERHAEYGLRFRADTLTHGPPKTGDAIRRYLGAGAVPGIGPGCADPIVDRFGEDTLTVLAGHPERLAGIPGITPRGAEKIAAALRERSAFRGIMELLTGGGFPDAAEIRVRRAFGDSAERTVLENPYSLCMMDDGFPFRRVDDAVAARFGIGADDPRRLEAGLLDVLECGASSGHTCMPEEQLLREGMSRLKADGAPVRRAVGALLESHRIFRRGHGGASLLSLGKYYRAERTVAQRVLAAGELDPAGIRTLSDEIDAVEKEQGIRYNAGQRKAIEEAVQRRFFILTGGPGTGKTTTLRAILALLRRRRERVLLAAPTGRAAKRMEEVTGEEARTIHRLLEPEIPESETLRFRRNSENPLDAETVIVDEASMLDVCLTEHLLNATRLRTRIILTGDDNQLPPVMAGNVLGDLIRSGGVPLVRLEHVFRQAAESRIVTAAHAIVRGAAPDLRNRTGGDLFLVRARNDEARLRAVVTLVADRIPERYGFSPLRDIQVITPAKTGAVSAAELNRRLQERLNPPDPGKREHASRDRIFREGDRVMQTKNNYGLAWTQDDGSAGTGICNGDPGILVSVDTEAREFVIRFDDRLVKHYPFDADDQLDHAYAMTVHKSQGSEFKAVVMPLMRSHPLLHCRNLLYTGVTRARKLLVIVGLEETVSEMVRNDQQTRRNTNLAEMIREETAREA